MTETGPGPDEPRTLTGADARASRTAVLQDAGVDLEALEQRRNAQLGATPPVLAAAQNVIDNLGTPGVSDRIKDLRDALEALMKADPVSAVVITSALWVDRYGSQGATLRLMDLQDAVDALHTP